MGRPTDDISGEPGEAPVTAPDEETAAYEVEVLTTGLFERGPSPEQLDHLSRERGGQAWKQTFVIAEQRRAFHFLKRKARLLVLEQPQEVRVDVPGVRSDSRSQSSPSESST
jgi:hypothetical protein